MSDIISLIDCCFDGIFDLLVGPLLSITAGIIFALVAYFVISSFFRY